MFRKICTRYLQIRGLHKKGETTPGNVWPMVPCVIEVTDRGHVANDIFSRLLKQRKICLFGPITDEVSNSIVGQLMHLHAESHKNSITMFINSPGGSLPAVLAIYDTMQFIKIPITTVCLGEAFNMAALLVAAGRRGMRYSLPVTCFMLNPWTGRAAEEALHVAYDEEEITHMKNKVLDLYMNHTKQPIEDISRLLKNETILNAKEAKASGLIDEILKQKPIFDDTL